MASLERSGRYHAALSRGRVLFQAPVVRFAFGVALSSLCLYLALRQVSLSETVRLLGQAHLGFIVLALLVVLANLFLKIWRWEVLLGRQVCRGNHWRIANAFLSAQLLNAVFPVRAGEISRVIALREATSGRSGGAGEDLTDEKFSAASKNRNHAGSVAAGDAITAVPQPSYTTLVSTVVLEKVIDTLAYSLLIVISLFLIALPVWLADSALLFLLILLTAVIALAGLLLWRSKAASLLSGLVDHLPQGYADWIRCQLRLALSSLDVLAAPVPLIMLSLSTVLVWGSALLTNYLAGLGLGIRLSWPAVVVLLVALQAGITLPSLPIRVGVFELVCVWVLQYMGFPQPTALSYGILLHVIVYLPVILFGALAIMILPVSARSRVHS